MPDLTVAIAKTPFLDRLGTDYLTAGRARGLSPKTIRYAQGYPLRGDFLRWCAGQDITEPAQPTTRVVERFQTDCSTSEGPPRPARRYHRLELRQSGARVHRLDAQRGEEVQA